MVLENIYVYIKEVYGKFRGRGLLIFNYNLFLVIEYKC